MRDKQPIGLPSPTALTPESLCAYNAKAGLLTYFPLSGLPVQAQWRGWIEYSLRAEKTYSSGYCPRITLDSLFISSEREPLRYKDK